MFIIKLLKTSLSYDHTHLILLENCNKISLKKTEEIKFVKIIVAPRFINDLSNLNKKFYQKSSIKTIDIVIINAKMN